MLHQVSSNVVIVEEQVNQMEIKPGSVILVDNMNPKDVLGISKPRIDLIPPASLIYQSLAMGLGADKYGAYNWRSKKVKMTIYLAAAMRHILSILDGQDDDDESGSPHIGHALACLGILADAKETGNLIDDRPVKGVAAELIKKYTKKRTV